MSARESGLSGENEPKYEMVYRCRYDGLDPAGCSWTTRNYADIDGHETLIDPGHYVSGEMERVTPPASTEGGGQR